MLERNAQREGHAGGGTAAGSFAAHPALCTPAFFLADGRACVPAPITGGSWPHTGESRRITGFERSTGAGRADCCLALRTARSLPGEAAGSAGRPWKPSGTCRARGGASCGCRSSDRRTGNQSATGTDQNTDPVAIARHGVDESSPDKLRRGGRPCNTAPPTLASSWRGNPVSRRLYCRPERPAHREGWGFPVHVRRNGAWCSRGAWRDLSVSSAGGVTDAGEAWNGTNLLSGRANP